MTLRGHLADVDRLDERHHGAHEDSEETNQEEEDNQNGENTENYKCNSINENVM